MHRRVSALKSEAIWASALVLGLIGLVKHAAQAVGGVGVGFVSVADLLLTAHLAFTLYFPLFRVGKNGVSSKTLGLGPKPWRTEAGQPEAETITCVQRSRMDEIGGTAFVMVITALVYGGALIGWGVGQGLAFSPRLPAGFIEQIPVEILVIGVSEELMFRGYLQERWSLVFPRSRWLSVVVAAAVFALAHFVGDYRPARLLTFFPGLVFGVMRLRYNSIAGAAVYHGFCNLLQDVLFESLHQG